MPINLHSEGQYTITVYSKCFMVLVQKYKLIQNYVGDICLFARISCELFCDPLKLGH